MRVAVFIMSRNCQTHKIGIGEGGMYILEVAKFSKFMDFSNSMGFCSCSESLSVLFESVVPKSNFL